MGDVFQPPSLSLPHTHTHAHIASSNSFLLFLLQTTENIEFQKILLQTLQEDVKEEQRKVDTLKRNARRSETILLCSMIHSMSDGVNTIFKIKPVA